MRYLRYIASVYCVLMLTGCVTRSGETEISQHTLGSDGQVLGGQNSVAGANIQLYAVGTLGDKTSAVPLLKQQVKTDANGNFTIQGLYSCTGATDVYLVATGGDSGAGRVNANLAMMLAVGPCTSLNFNKPLLINELTTVAAVNAISSYMSDYPTVGSGIADAAALDNAFSFANQLVNPATGTAPGLTPLAGYTVPVSEINMLGDVMASCVNSAGGIAGDGSPCGNLFSLTTAVGSPPPTNTAAAMLNLAMNPGCNTDAIFRLASANFPFQPQLSSAPPSFGIQPVPTAPNFILTANPISLNFSVTEIGSTSVAENVNVQNLGQSGATISNIGITGDHAADFTQTNNCPAILAAGAACTVQISFSPQSTNPSSATLQVNNGLLSVGLSGTSQIASWSEIVLAMNPSVYLNFNDQTTSFIDQASGMAFSTGGAVVPGQPGFDSTQPNNTSAAFSWNGWNQAPNNTIGDIDWNVPWTMLLQIDRLNWNRSGTLVLASKGDILTTTKGWWALTLGMAGGHSQLCFERNGPGFGLSAQDGICTADYFEAMPNGFNYNIVIEDNGSGEVGIGGSGTTSALSMYINGLPVELNGQTRGGPFSNSYSTGFGAVSLSVTGGSGYADLTPFTSVGGGLNCNVTGFMWANNGVPYNGNWSPAGYSNYGCTSTPAIVLTSPTGSGAVITAALTGTSMNSPDSPLMVPGYVANGVQNGIGGMDTTQTSILIDEFAILPGNITASQITSLYDQTKFYQGLVNKSSTPGPVLVFDNDAGGDMDNFFSLAMAISLHKQGFITLAGTVIEDQSVTCEATWRQILDQAGLQSIPLSVPSSFPYNSGTGFCTTANVNTFDASTPQSNAAWISSTAMYRTVFAENATVPIDIILGGPFTALAEFMQSPADNISPMTGLQLMARNAANGGAVYAQGLVCSGSTQIDSPTCSATITGDNSLVDWVSGQYVVSHNGTTPIYWAGGNPMDAGPGVSWARTSKDPLFLLTQTVGSDIRQCWDCLAVEDAVSSYFYGGVQITPSGGTGYADFTPFTSTGGGPHCYVAGVMTAQNGIPNGLQLPYPDDDVPYTGIGWGCDSAPTINLVGSTGTGANLAAVPTSVCGTYTITGLGAGNVSSSTCSNHYFRPYSRYSDGEFGLAMTWFINSLVNPTP